jgi:carboxypeptidase C (cathepsin A)
MKYLVAALLLVGICTVNCAIAGDLVNMTNLQGFPTSANFSMYSGYLNISAMKQIHYVLYTQFNTNSTTNAYPLSLWLQGGPGCSGMEGILQEMGPIVMSDEQWYFNGTYNPWSWNQFANILIFEAPAGVGFSIDNTPGGFNNTDNSSATDNLASLLLFFQGYPELLPNDFWINGESYGGIYIPYLAAWIDTYNSNSSNTPKINLQGIMVGNGVNNMNTLQDSTVEYQYQHTLMPPYIYNMYENSCGNDPNSAGCNFAQNQINTYTNFVNPYNIYAYCFYQNYTPPNQTDFEFVPPTNKRFLYTPWAAPEVQPAPQADFSCVWVGGMSLFLQNPQNMAALNVDQNITWSACANINYNDTDSSSYWAYEQLLASNTTNGQNYSIYVYSGDADSVVPWIDSVNWIGNLNLPIVEPWRAWWSVDPSWDWQVSGYVQRYQGLTYLTVKGAGHMVPQWKRQPAMVMFAYALNNTLLPYEPYPNTTSTTA